MNTNKTFDIALGIFLFLSPIFFLPKSIPNINALQFYQFGILGDNGYNYLQLQFFQYGIIVLFIVSLLSKPQREFKDKNSIILFLLFCLSVYIHPISVKLFGNIFLGFFLYYLATVFTKNYKNVFKFIFAVSLLNTLFAVLQFFNINLIYRPTGRYDGLMCLSPHLGIYQAIALPICYALNPYLVIIPIIGILLSKSITATFIMLVWLLVTFRKKIIERGSVFFMLGVSLIGLFLFRNYYSIIEKLNIRFMVWIPTLKMISQKFLWGYGIKPFRFESSIGLFENPCSIYLEMVYFLGIFALIPLCLIIKNLFKSKDIILLSCAIIALLSGIEKSIMDYPRLAGTVICLLAFVNMKGETDVNTY